MDSSGGISAQQENQEGQKSAALSWDPPTTNADGTDLTDLAGYKVNYRTDSTNYTSIDVGLTTTPESPEYTVDNLEPGSRYYFNVTAYDTSGNESGYSEEAYKDIL